MVDRRSHDADDKARRQRLLYETSALDAPTVAAPR
jgi:hypothetical protein